MLLAVDKSGPSAAYPASFKNIPNDGSELEQTQFDALGRCNMAGFDEHSEQIECNGAEGESAIRHDFLSTVSQLPHADPASRRDLGLAHTIEAEIIPRLMLAHKGAASKKRNQITDGPNLSPADMDRFSTVICAANLAEARSFIAGLRARNVSTEVIMLDLLAPTAKLLGEMWEEDDADFAFVTIALCCLQQVLRDISGVFETTVGAKPSYRALLAPAPGDQHIFSVLMVDEFFRRADWDVWTMPAATEGELLDVVRRESFDMVGFSINCDVWLPQLTRLIARIRAASRNEKLVIMVGGRPLLENPDLVTQLGADATARDGLDAVRTAGRIVSSAAKVQSGLSLV